MKAYDLICPKQLSSAVLFASPHSGRDYSAFPADVILSPDELRSSEDVLVDEIVGDVAAHGCVKLSARAPRAFVDLNRNADELDSALLSGAPKLFGNARVAAGLGVIPRVVAHGRPIYRGKMPLGEGLARLEHIWRPYHEALDLSLKQLRDRFGRAILIDMHSMPDNAVPQHLEPRPRIVIGDRFGRSALPDIVARVEETLARSGVPVARNAPFAGAYIAERYGRPDEGLHAIQIEIDRSLYQDPEAPFARSAKFRAFAEHMRPFLAEIAALGAEYALAAQ